MKSIPLSIADLLRGGGTTPTPLGQLSLCVRIDAQPIKYILNENFGYFYGVEEHFYINRESGAISLIFRTKRYGDVWGRVQQVFLFGRLWARTILVQQQNPNLDIMSIRSCSTYYVSLESQISLPPPRTISLWRSPSRSVCVHLVSIAVRECHEQGF